MGSIIEDVLRKSWDCRKRESSDLENYFSRPLEVHSLPLFVWGPTCVGKTTLVRHLLSKMSKPHSYIACHQIGSVSQLFDQIFQNLAGVPDTTHKPIPTKTLNWPVVISNLNQIIEQLKDPLFLVFDGVERFDELDASLFSLLSSFHETIGPNVRFVFISHTTCDRRTLDQGTMIPECEHIYFREYTKEQIQTILLEDLLISQDQPETSLQRSTAQSFVGLLVGTVYQQCPILLELMAASRRLYPVYMEPINSGRAQPSQTGDLFKSISPHIKQWMDTVFLPSESRSQAQSPDEVIESRFPLPRTGQLLVLASFLAFHNPPSLDERFFSKERAEFMDFKKSRANSGRMKIGDQFKTYAFGVERLLHVLRGIDSRPYRTTSTMLSQIATLESLGFISRVSAARHTPLLPRTKYQCNVEKEDVVALGKSVGVDVEAYLATSTK